MRPAMTWFAAAGEPTSFSRTPDWALIDFNRVVLAAQTLWFRNRPEGVVLWQGLPGELLRPRLRDMLTRARERGCRVSDVGLTTGWFTFLHEGYPTVMLGIGPLISQSRTTFGDLGEEARILAERLARYADVTGAVWRGTGGLSGTAGIRALHETRGLHDSHAHTPMWRWKRTDVPVGMVGCSFELSPSKHRRALTPDERRGSNVHHFDIRAMYLAAAGVAMLGWSAPEHTGPREFDPGVSGYWQVRRDELDAVKLPGRVMRSTVYRPGDSPLLWVTTPVLTYLIEHGGMPEVFDSWTCKRTGRYLREWAARLTAARKALAVDDRGNVNVGVMRALKDTYARTIGMFNRETSRVYRSDWWDTCRDTARINLVRKVEAASYVAPCRYNVDSIWVPSGQRYAHEVGAALGTRYTPDGREIDKVGKFKHIALYTTSQYLAKFERDAIAA